MRGGEILCGIGEVRVDGVRWSGEGEGGDCLRFRILVIPRDWGTGEISHFVMPNSGESRLKSQRPHIP